MDKIKGRLQILNQVEVDGHTHIYTSRRDGTSVIYEWFRLEPTEDPRVPLSQAQLDRARGLHVRIMSEDAQVEGSLYDFGCDNAESDELAEVWDTLLAGSQVTIGGGAQPPVRLEVI